jgi:hypothetical protein
MSFSSPFEFWTSEGNDEDSEADRGYSRGGLSNGVIHIERQERLDDTSNTLIV